MADIDPIPAGYHSVTPYLVTESVPKLLDFVRKAFDAKVTERLELPDGTIKHAEVRIGDSPVMMGQAGGGRKPVKAMLYLYVENCDTAYEKALDAGGTPVMKPADQFYGDRSGGVVDPTGNEWWFGSRIENLSSDEIVERMKNPG